jgi:hypothetical protein
MQLLSIARRCEIEKEIGTSCRSDCIAQRCGQRIDGTAFDSLRGNDELSLPFLAIA